jgi:excisionase family DNA binding protein
MKTPSNAPLATSLSDHVSTVEAGRILGLAVRSVQLMVDRGELSAWKTPGGHRRITRQSVNDWRDHEQQPSPPPLVASAPRHDKNTGHAKVLLIEDSMHFQNLMKLLLNQQFPMVELEIASDSISGLAMVGQYQPHVLIVDILLPGIDGATVITGLRTHVQFQNIQLIVCTSLSADQLEPYAFALEGVTVIHKPRLVADLPPVLARLLHNHKARTQRAAGDTA